VLFEGFIRVDRSKLFLSVLLLIGLFLDSSKLVAAVKPCPAISAELLLQRVEAYNEIYNEVYEFSSKHQKVFLAMMKHAAYFYLQVKCPKTCTRSDYLTAARAHLQKMTDLSTKGFMGFIGITGALGIVTSVNPSVATDVSLLGPAIISTAMIYFLGRMGNFQSERLDDRGRQRWSSTMTDINVEDYVPGSSRSVLPIVKNSVLTRDEQGQEWPILRTVGSLRGSGNQAWEQLKTGDKDQMVTTLANMMIVWTMSNFEQVYSFAENGKFATWDITTPDALYLLSFRQAIRDTFYTPMVKHGLVDGQTKGTQGDFSDHKQISPVKLRKAVVLEINRLLASFGVDPLPGKGIELVMAYLREAIPNYSKYEAEKTVNSNIEVD